MESKPQAGLQPDQKVGPYVLIEKLGAGGLGEVWKARDPRLNRIVALKFLAAEQTGTSSPRELLREARAASALNHPNIVTIFDVGESEGRTYLAMEFVEGETLRARLARSPVAFEEALEIAAQISSGLAAAHRNGLVHRDLKPENIMLRADGYVKLLDFGLAKKLPWEGASVEATADSLATKSGQLVGTVTYMSPEQARGQPVSTSSDVFAAGIVLYELFTGEHPFRRETALDTLSAILNAEPVSVNQLRPDTPAQLGDIISRSLRKSPPERLSSGVELFEQLQRARSASVSPAAGAALPVVKAKPRWMQALGGVLIAAVLGAGVWQLQFSEPAADVALVVQSVAVLTFRTAPEDATAIVFAQDLPDELGAALSAMGFRIASRSSVLQLPAVMEPRTIGQQLGVDAVLEGNVRRYGARLRIHVALVSTRTGFQLWSQTFTAETSDLLTSEQKLAAEIVAEVRQAVPSPR